MHWALIIKEPNNINFLYCIQRRRKKINSRSLIFNNFFLFMVKKINNNKLNETQENNNCIEEVEAGKVMRKMENGDMMTFIFIMKSYDLFLIYY